MVAIIENSYGTSSSLRGSSPASAPTGTAAPPGPGHRSKFFDAMPIFKPYLGFLFFCMCFFFQILHCDLEDRKIPVIKTLSLSICQRFKSGISSKPCLLCLSPLLLHPWHKLSCFFFLMHLYKMEPHFKTSLA